MSIDAMKRALEFIEQNNYGGDDSQRIMFTLRFAIEQAERQEPVAYRIKTFGSVHKFVVRPDVADECAGKLGEVHGESNVTVDPVYTAPPQRQPLLFSQRKAIADKLGLGLTADFNAVVAEIERAHEIGDKV